MRDFESQMKGTCMESRDVVIGSLPFVPRHSSFSGVSNGRD